MHEIFVFPCNGENVNCFVLSCNGRECGARERVGEGGGYGRDLVQSTGVLGVRV